jgi:hypothetical protein
MKVSIDPDGKVELDVNNGETQNAIEFIRQLQKEKKREETIKEIEHEERVQHSAELNKTQYETWDFLIDHDCDAGVPVAGIARALNSTCGAVSHRLGILVNKGYAVRTQRGYYRARTP